MIIGSEQKRHTSASMQENHIYIFLIANIQIQIQRRTKASLISISQVDFFYLP